MFGLDYHSKPYIIQANAEIIDPLLVILVEGAWLEIPGSKITIVNI